MYTTCYKHRALTNQCLPLNTRWFEWTGNDHGSDFLLSPDTKTETRSHIHENQTNKANMNCILLEFKTEQSTEDSASLEFVCMWKRERPKKQALMMYDVCTCTRTTK